MHCTLVWFPVPSKSLIHTQGGRRQWRRKAKHQKREVKWESERGAGYQPIVKENALLQKYYQVKNDCREQHSNVKNLTRDNQWIFDPPGIQ